MRIPSGKTDQNLYFVAVDSVDYVTRETGLSSFTAVYSLNGAADVTFTTPTVTQIDATTMPGVYSLLMDEGTTIASSSDSEELCVHITHAGMAPVTRTVEIYRRDTTSGQTSTVTAGIVSANAVQISGDSAAADNLEAQFDGTGLTGDTYPASQLQLDSLANTGSAGAYSASTYVLTTGTQSANTYVSTRPLDGIRHEHTDTAGAMDLYYQFQIGTATPTSVTVTGYLTGGNDNLEVYGYDWVSVAWVQIGTLTGKGTATNDVNTYTLFTDMVGTGANVGLVRIRFTDGAFTLTTATLAIDQIYVTGAIVAITQTEVATAVWNAATSTYGSAGSYGLLVETNLDGTVSSRLATASYTTPPTASQNAAELLDYANGIEAGITLRQATRAMLSESAGKLSGADTATNVFRNAIDTKDRITATVDSVGNRTAITLDLT